MGSAEWEVQDTRYRIGDAEEDIGAEMGGGPLRQDCVDSNFPSMSVVLLTSAGGLAIEH